MLLRNQLYAGIVDVPEYSVRNKRGDFKPLIRKRCSIESRPFCPGRSPITAPRQRTTGLPVARIRAVRLKWSRPDRELVEGPSGSRLMPLPGVTGA